MCKKTNLSKFSGNSAALLTDTTLPAVLNNCSKGTDVPTIHRYLRAIKINWGKCTC